MAPTKSQSQRVGHMGSKADKLNVHQLVYRYLESLANSSATSKRNAASSFRKFNNKKRRLDRNDAGASKKSPATGENNNLPLESSYERIARYAKAVDEGRKLAKNYVRKAITFGMRTGYLIPTNHGSLLLKVSSDLGFYRKQKRQEEADKKRRQLPKSQSLLLPQASSSGSRKSKSKR